VTNRTPGAGLKGLKDIHIVVSSDQAEKPENICTMKSIREAVKLIASKWNM
jgi:hypothetical protein